MPAVKSGLLYACSGLLWAILAGALGASAFGPALLFGLLASPAIGIALGSVLQPLFEQHTGWRRALIPPCTVYLAATLFGIAIGIGDVILADGPRDLELLWQPIAGVWYGASVFLILFWPLAHVTHSALAARRRAP